MRADERNGVGETEAAASALGNAADAARLGAGCGAPLP
jgi:hypothetical protein